MPPTGLARCSDEENTAPFWRWRPHNTHMATSAWTGELAPRITKSWPVRVFTTWATAVAALTVLFTAMTRPEDDPGSFVERGLPAWLMVVGLAMIAIMIVALWTTQAYRPKVAVGLAVATAGSLLPLWAAWSWLPASIRAAALATAPLVVAGVAHVAQGWSTDSPPGGLRSMRVAYLLAGTAGLLHVLGYNPFADPGCSRACVDVRPALAGLVSTKTTVIVTSVLVVAASLVTAVAVLTDRRRRTPGPVVVAVLAALAGLAFLAGIRVAAWGDPATSGLLLILAPVAVAIVAVPPCVVGVRTLRTRSAVERLASRLEGPQSALDHLGGAIREVQFAVPGDLRWVDARGRGLPDVPTHDRRVVLADDSGPSVRLLVTRRADDGEVLTALTPATRLALKNAQLSAVAKARLADVQASQRRVVARSDAERRRIERDLHDGAQQRLVSAAFHLRVAEADADPVMVERLRHAEERIREALAHLRRLAHGIFPGVLATEGLGTALADLAASSDVPATLALELRDDLGAEAALAAYATIAAAIDHVLVPSSDTVARISAVQNDDILTVMADVTAGAGIVGPLEFTEVADRVGAVGGRFVQSATADGGVVVTAVIPCES